MAIRLYDNKIEFDDGSGNIYTLTETSSGFDFVGVLTSEKFYSLAQGSNYGFVSGGFGTPGPAVNSRDRFSFASSGVSVEPYGLLGSEYVPNFGGNVTNAPRGAAAGQSSSSFGYTSGGIWPLGTPFIFNAIDRFPFAASANGTNIGDLITARYHSAGHSSTVSGYTSGGKLSNNAEDDTIDKFPFSTESNATDVGNLFQGRYGVAGISSGENGYTTGGTKPPLSPNILNTIERFSFSSDGNGTDTADLSSSRRYLAGHSSFTHGYNSGGETSPGVTSAIIDKFPFSINSSSTSVGNLTISRKDVTGHSSTMSGYTVSGTLSNANNNTIEKFPFSTDSGSSDIGDLASAASNRAGQQY